MVSAGNNALAVPEESGFGIAEGLLAEGKGAVAEVCGVDFRDEALDEVADEDIVAALPSRDTLEACGAAVALLVDS